MPQHAGLAVILLNWRDEDLTLRCAAMVRGWTSVHPLLVVVDNESTAASSAALEHGAGAAKLICHKANLGFAGGNNRGIRWAIEQRVDHILLLNTDACIAEAGVLALRARLDACPGIAVAGPLLEQGADGEGGWVAGGRDIARHASTRVAIGRRDIKTLSGYPLHEVDYVPGAVLVARRATFEKIGLFDEQFFFSGEVADWCKRIRGQGGRVCIDLDVVARHDGQDRHALRETLYVYYSLRNRFLFARKHYAAAWPWYFPRWTAIGLWELAKNIARRRWGTARAIRLALLDGLGGKFGNRNFRFHA